MTSYKFDPEQNEVIPSEEWNAKYGKDVSRSAHVWLDTPEVISPVTWKPLEGRAARREHMKRHNLIEVGNERRPAKSGRQLDF